MFIDDLASVVWKTIWIIPPENSGVQKRRVCMKMSRYTDSQILGILKQAEAWCPCSRAMPGTRHEQRHDHVRTDIAKGEHPNRKLVGSLDA